MSEEILINVTPRETRVAVVENGVLQEVFIERARRRGIVGKIYRGKVCRVLPGMQAAFVDIGLERAAFLHASDVSPRSPDNDAEGNAESLDAIGDPYAAIEHARAGNGRSPAGGRLGCGHDRGWLFWVAAV